MRSTLRSRLAVAWIAVASALCGAPGAAAPTDDVPLSVDAPDAVDRTPGTLLSVTVVVGAPSTTGTTLTVAAAGWTGVAHTVQASGGASSAERPGATVVLARATDGAPPWTVRLRGRLGSVEGDALVVTATASRVGAASTASATVALRDVAPPALRALRLGPAGPVTVDGATAVPFSFVVDDDRGVRPRDVTVDASADGGVAATRTLTWPSGATLDGALRSLSVAGVVAATGVTGTPATLRVSVRATDVGGNASATSVLAVTLAQTAGPRAGIDVEGPLSCATPTVRLTGLAAGGRSPHRYAWAGGETTADAVAEGTGEHAVTVWDADGRSSRATAVVTAAGPRPEVRLDGAALTCAAPRATLRPSVTGGSPPYAYAWSRVAPDGSLTALGTAATLEASEAGRYRVEVADAGDPPCRARATVRVVAPAGPPTVVVPPIAPVSCAKPTTRVAPVVSGGTPFLSGDAEPKASFRYLWRYDGDANVLGTGAWLDVAGTAGRTLRFRVEDAAGCVVEVTGIAVPRDLEAPAVTIDGAGPLTCACDVRRLEARATGGRPPYAYRWSTGAETAAVRVVDAGTYTVAVTGGNGCAATATVTVAAERGAPQVTVAASNDVDPPLAPEAELVATVRGGVGPFAFAWTGPAGDVVGTAAALRTATPGTYRVLVTGANGCATEAEGRVKAALVEAPSAGAILEVAVSDRWLVVLSRPKRARPDASFDELTAFAQPAGTRAWTRRFADVAGSPESGRLQLHGDRLAFVGAESRPSAANVGLHVLDVANGGADVAFVREGAGVARHDVGPYAFGPHGSVVELSTGARRLDGAAGRPLRLLAVVGARGLYEERSPTTPSERSLALTDPSGGTVVWRATGVPAGVLGDVAVLPSVAVQDDFPLLLGTTGHRDRTAGLLFVPRDGAARLLGRTTLGVSEAQVTVTLARTRAGVGGRVLVVGLASGGPTSGPTHETFVALDERGTVLGRLDVPTVRTRVHGRYVTDDGDLVVVRTDLDASPRDARDVVTRHRVPTAAGSGFVEAWSRRLEADFGHGDAQGSALCGGELLLLDPRPYPASTGILGLRGADGALSRVLAAEDLGLGRPGYRLASDVWALANATHLFVVEWTPDDAKPSRVVRLPWAARGTLDATLSVPTPVYTGTDVALSVTPAAAHVEASAGTVRGLSWRTPTTPGPVVLTVRSGDLLAPFSVDVLDRSLVADADGDGLTDAEEARLRTDPARKDTDGDGADDLVDLAPTTAPRSLPWTTTQGARMLRTETPVRAVGVDGRAEVWSTGFLGATLTRRGTWAEHGTKRSDMDAERVRARLGVSPGDRAGDFECIAVEDAAPGRFRAPDEHDVTWHWTFDDSVIGRTKEYRFLYRLTERWFLARYANATPTSVSVPAETYGPLRGGAAPPPFAYVAAAVRLRPGLPHRFALQVRVPAGPDADGLGLSWALYPDADATKVAWAPLLDGFSPGSLQGTALRSDGSASTDEVVGFEIRVPADRATRETTWLKATLVSAARTGRGTVLLPVRPEGTVTGIVREVVLEDDAARRRTTSIVEDLPGVEGLGAPFPSEAEFVAGGEGPSAATRLPDAWVHRAERLPDGRGGWRYRLSSAVTTVVTRTPGVVGAVAGAGKLVQARIEATHEDGDLAKALKALPKGHWARSPALGRTLTAVAAAKGVVSVVVGTGRVVAAATDEDYDAMVLEITRTGLAGFEASHGVAKLATAYGLVGKSSRAARFSKLGGAHGGALLAVAAGAASAGADLVAYSNETDPVRKVELRDRLLGDAFTTGLGVVAAYWPPLAAGQATWAIGTELYRTVFGEDFAYRVASDLGGALAFVAVVLVGDALPGALCDEAWRKTKAAVEGFVEAANANPAEPGFTVFVDPDLR